MVDSYDCESMALKAANMPPSSRTEDEVQSVIIFGDWVASMLSQHPRVKYT
jgi:hypothetical protein